MDEEADPAQAGGDTADDAATVGDAKSQEKKFW